MPYGKRDTNANFMCKKKPLIENGEGKPLRKADTYNLPGFAGKVNRKDQAGEWNSGSQNQPGSVSQHVPAIKKQAHTFKYQAADEKNRGLAFLTRRLAIKRQIVDF